MGIGNFLGNIIGVVILLVLLGAAFFYPIGSSIAFVSTMYGAWVLVMASHLATMPKRHSRFCSKLDAEEFQIFKMFHLAIIYSEGASIYSSILNLFRIVGLPWGAICLWSELYYFGTAMIAFYFISSGMIVKHNPYLYLSEGVNSGNIFAMKEAELFKTVLEKYQDFRETRNDVS